MWDALRFSEEEIYPEDYAYLMEEKVQRRLF
jgi:hypothetical protein